MAARREIVAKWIRDMLPRKCVNCGSTSNLQYHHIVPVSFGGNDGPSNVAVLCGDCHSLVHYGKRGIINHGEAVKEGQRRARECGKPLGRKPADGEKIMRLIAENSTQFVNVYDAKAPLYTETEIMEMAGVKPVCYHKYKRRLLALMDADEWPFEWERPKKLRNMPLYDRVVKRMRSETA